MEGSWRGADVLVVDDDAATRELIGGILAPRGHACVLSEDAASARRALMRQSFALALCDIGLPGESGMQLANHIVAEHPETAVLMVTSYDDPRLADTALAFGAFGYLLKPFRPKELVIAVSAALRRRDAQIEGRCSRDALEREASELRAAVERLEHTTQSVALPADETVERLTRAIAARSHETGNHIARVGAYAGALARRIGLPGSRCRRINQAARLHDIGKVAISDRVLLKPGPLTPEERQEMERHTSIGYEVLAGSDSDVLRLGAEIALTHHECFDGRGYPRGMLGATIPLEGRITAIADVFDALTHDRVYRPAYPEFEALRLMTAERGRQFDPELFDAFLAHLEEIRHEAETRNLSVSA